MTHQRQIVIADVVQRVFVLVQKPRLTAFGTLIKMPKLQRLNRLQLRELIKKRPFDAIHLAGAAAMIPCSEPSPNVQNF